MNPRITDRDVARLALRKGRSELLEEIMSTPSQSPARPEAPLRTAPRWTVMAAAAASVALVVGGPLLLVRSPHATGVAGAPTGVPASPLPTLPTTPASSPASSPGAAEDPTPSPTPDSGPAGTTYPILTAPGWHLDRVSSDGAPPGFTETAWAKGDATVELSAYAAQSHGLYVADRDESPSGPTIDVAGVPSPSWTYAATDHTTIRPVVDGSWFEVRVQGPDAAGFAAVVASVKLVGIDDLAPLLPADAVLPGDQQAAATTLLQGTATPPGFDVAALPIPAPTETSLMVYDLATAVTCGWADEYDAGRRAHDDARTQAAVDALAGALDWPMIRDDPSYPPDFLRPGAEAMRLGEPAGQVWQALSCPGHGPQPGRVGTLTGSPTESAVPALPAVPAG